jgi:type VI secretion system secreted protein VgrG
MFKLTTHPNKRFNQKYVVVGMAYSAASESFRSSGGGGGDGGAPLSLQIEAIPATTTWRAPLLHRKPIARGPQNAIVTGPGGEVIHVDKYGRVKVRFYWDRVNPLDDTSSCWIRVADNWADKGFGTLMLPRIGQEVIVDFLDGDPTPCPTTRRARSGAPRRSARPGRTIPTPRSRRAGPGSTNSASRTWRTRKKSTSTPSAT